MMTSKKSPPSANREQRIESVAEYLTVLYSQADTLLGVTKWEAIPMLEESLEDMERRQYARACLSFDEGQSDDMKARLDMLRATIAFLKARKEHYEAMKDAQKTKQEQAAFDELISNLI